MDNALRTRIGLTAFACFLASIPLANWMIGHVGTTCLPHGPCLVPVAPGLLAPSGVLTVGAALVLRDVVQRCLGPMCGLLAIGIGTALSALVAPGALVIASGCAFALSECADFAVYTPLQRRQLTLGGGRLVGCRVGGRFGGVPGPGIRQSGFPRRSGRWQAVGGAGRHPAVAPVAPGGADTCLMRLADFDFDLPAGLIAQHPVRPRDAARLLHVMREGLADRVVRDLPSLLRPGDVLVVNDTRVIPAQFVARRGAARIGITLDQPRPDGSWHALARNARRLHVGDELTFDGSDELRATVLRREPDGGVTLAFNRHDDAMWRAGVLALPPYIERPSGPLPQDDRDYQTFFARNEGAVAAPTAGLHFTPELLDALEQRGVRRVTVTLHVGAGTFLPVRSEDIAQHHMHAERGEISPDAAAAINAAQRVVAVGTTSLRLLEIRRGGRRLRASIFRGNQPVHRAWLPVQGCRCAVDQLSSAAFDSVHAGLCICRHGTHARRVCACDRSWISVLFLRRRLSAGTPKSSPSPCGRG